MAKKTKKIKKKKKKQPEYNLGKQYIRAPLVKGAFLLNNKNVFIIKKYAKINTTNREVIWKKIRTQQVL